MRLAGIVTILLMGALVLGACGGQAATPKGIGPAAFTTSKLTIAPDTIRPGEDAIIGVLLTNTGAQTGTYTLVLKIDGDIAKTQEVTLSGGTGQRVTFSVTIFDAGNYEVTVDQLTGVLIVMDG